MERTQQTWALELAHRAEEVICMLDALSKVEWDTRPPGRVDGDPELDDEDEAARVAQSLRGARKAIEATLCIPHLDEPSVLSPSDLNAFDIGAWRDGAYVAAFENAALVHKLALGFSHGYESGEKSELSHAVGGVGRLLDELAIAIDAAGRTGGGPEPASMDT